MLVLSIALSVYQLALELLMEPGWHPLVLRSEALLCRVVQTCLGMIPPLICRPSSVILSAAESKDLALEYNALTLFVFRVTDHERLNPSSQNPPPLPPVFPHIGACPSIRFQNA